MGVSLQATETFICNFSRNKTLILFLCSFKVVKSFPSVSMLVPKRLAEMDSVPMSSKGATNTPQCLMRMESFPLKSPENHSLLLMFKSSVDVLNNLKVQPSVPNWTRKLALTVALAFHLDLTVIGANVFLGSTALNVKRRPDILRITDISGWILWVLFTKEKSNLNLRHKDKVVCYCTMGPSQNVSGFNPSFFPFIFVIVHQGLSRSEKIDPHCYLN